MTYSVLCKGDKVYVYPRLGKPWAGEVWRRSDREGYVFIQPKEEGHWAREQRDCPPYILSSTGDP